MKLDMIKNEKKGDLKTRNYVMVMEETDKCHIAGFGKLKEIKNDPMCMFNLDILIEHLQNARELINPHWNDGDEEIYRGPERYRVYFWEHNPCLVLNEGVKDQKVYGVAPILTPDLKKHMNWKMEEKKDDINGEEEKAKD